MNKFGVSVDDKFVQIKPINMMGIMFDKVGTEFVVKEVNDDVVICHGAGGVMGIDAGVFLDFFEEVEDIYDCDGCDDCDDNCNCNCSNDDYDDDYEDDEDDDNFDDYCSPMNKISTAIENLELAIRELRIEFCKESFARAKAENKLNKIMDAIRKV